MVAYKWTVLSNTTLGGLMASINGTIMLISLPVIFTGLGINPLAPESFTILIWILLGYGVVTATLLVNAGRLSDMMGRARMYNLGFAIFTVGSIALFLTPGTGDVGGWEMVGLRLVQAVGASFLFANSAALLTDAFPSNERGKALGINQVAFIGGSVLGLVVGGVLSGLHDVDVGSWVIPAWRLIFLVNVPVGLFGTVWAYVKLHDLRPAKKGQTVDFLGNLTFAVGLILLLIGLTYSLLPYGSQSEGWGNPWVLLSIVVGAAFLGIFLVVEHRVRDPMFRLELFRLRPFAAGNVAAFLGSIARGGVMFMLIIWFQGIWLPLHGYSFSETPFWAGIYMLPLMAGFFVFGPVSGWISDKYGAKHLASLGMIVGSMTFFLFLLLPYNFPYWAMGLLMFTQGAGMGMFAAPNVASVMNSVPPEHRGAASGMLSTLQNTGQQVSMVIFFTIIIGGLASGLSGSVSGAVVAACSGTSCGNSPDPSILAGMVSQSPTGALFAAFLGENPMQVVVAGAAQVPGWSPLPNSVYQTLLGKSFFPNAIAPAFLTGMHWSFLFAGGLTLVAAGISFLRGERYVHDEHAHVRKARHRAPEASPDAAEVAGEAPSETSPARRESA